MWFLPFRLTLNKVPGISALHLISLILNLYFSCKTLYPLVFTSCTYCGMSFFNCQFHCHTSKLSPSFVYERCLYYLQHLLNVSSTSSAYCVTFNLNIRKKTFYWSQTLCFCRWFVHGSTGVDTKIEKWDLQKWIVLRACESWITPIEKYNLN